MHCLLSWLFEQYHLAYYEQGAVLPSMLIGLKGNFSLSQFGFYFFLVLLINCIGYYNIVMGQNDQTGSKQVNNLVRISKSQHFRVKTSVMLAILPYFQEKRCTWECFLLHVPWGSVLGIFLLFVYWPFAT